MSAQAGNGYSNWTPNLDKSGHVGKIGDGEDPIEIFHGCVVSALRVRDILNRSEFDESIQKHLENLQNNDLEISSEIFLAAMELISTNKDIKPEQLYEHIQGLGQEDKLPIS